MGFSRLDGVDDALQRLKAKYRPENEFMRPIMDATEVHQMARQALFAKMTGLKGVRRGVSYPPGAQRLGALFAEAVRKKWAILRSRA